MLKHTVARPADERQTLGSKGFTLIELLVVIIILGILAAVVVFAVQGVTDDSEANSCQTEGRTLLTAIESYNAETGGYPANMGVLTTGNKWLRRNPTYWSLSGTSGDIARVTTGPKASAVTTGQCDVSDID